MGITNRGASALHASGDEGYAGNAEHQYKCCICHVFLFNAIYALDNQVSIHTTKANADTWNGKQRDEKMV